MGPVDLPELGKRTVRGTETEAGRKQVLDARAMQHARYGILKTNSDLSPRELEDFVPLSSGARATLEKAGQRLSFSPRAFHRVIKVSRTIADLDASPDINESHILEALQYRQRKS